MVFNILFNIANRGKRFLCEETLLRKAEAKTGLSDWGDIPFREPFHQLVASINLHTQLNAQGVFILNYHFGRLLGNNLRLVEYWKQNLQINDIEIKAPLVILGLPRTGTTFLHTLISLDSKFRSLKYWELLFPVPNESQKWRKTKAKGFVRGIDFLSPKLSTIHKLDALGPEECCFIFDHLFLDSIHNLVFHVPEYHECYLRYDHLPSYQFHKKMLQTYSLNEAIQPFALKAPRHLYCLDALLKTYPDAKIVWTHRDPVEAVASLCSLSETGRQIVSDQIDREKIGRLVLEFAEAECRGGQQGRALAKPTQIVDVSYQQLVDDPIEVLRLIYDHFCLDFTEQYEMRLMDYLKERHNNRRNSHRYSIEDYVISKNYVYYCLGEYCQPGRMGCDSSGKRLNVK